MIKIFIYQPGRFLNFGLVLGFFLTADLVLGQTVLIPEVSPNWFCTTGTLGTNTALIVTWPKSGVQLELLKVPAGSFRMGATNGDSDERPIHAVYLDEYWIGKYEVTAQQYTLFLNDIRRDRTEQHIYLDTQSPDALIQAKSGLFQCRAGFEKFPVVGVTWYGAAAYCTWLKAKTQLNFVLPTEAQWEKAARGDLNDGRIFPWGIRLNPGLAHYKSDQPAAVGSYPKGISPYGAYDMAGNAAEWCRDWYDENYYRRSPVANPTGPESGQSKVLRGGSWFERLITIPKLRSADRQPWPPALMNLTIGFRVALEGKLTTSAQSNQ